MFRLMQKSKFLVVHPDANNIDEVIDKCNIQQNKVGPFERFLVLGNCIKNVDNLPTKKFLRPALFTNGSYDISKGKCYDNTENDFCLIRDDLQYARSNFSLVNLDNGLKIGLLSGLNQIGTQTNVEQEVKPKLKDVEYIDILITFEWPEVIAKQEKLFLVGYQLVDTIVKLSRPRYHFAVGTDEGRYFENNPFLWKNRGEEIISRFISLGKQGGKEKWYYAFEISHKATSTSNVALYPNPFVTNNIEIRKRAAENVKEYSKETMTPKKPKLVMPDRCFFCLSNPKLESHMIISISKYSYLAIAKGPLTMKSSNIPFSGHVLIIPINHIPSINNKSGDFSDLDALTDEMFLYENSIFKAFRQTYPEKSIISFEISRPENVHFHRQIIPVNINLLNRFESSLDFCSIKNEKYSNNQKFSFKKFEEHSLEMKDIISKNNYMLFTIHYEDKEEFFLAILNEPGSIDLQFPRRVIAHLIHQMRRIYWEKCKTSKLEEAQDCRSFKDFYSKFDIAS